MLTGKRILIIITGSIASYKSLELIRLLRKAGASVEGVLTRAGAAFITPLAVETLTGKRAHTDMWDERAYEMNHIELSRRSDLIVVAPATADIIAKMANGIGDDLASTLLLARNKPVLLAPSMNSEMWRNAAFRRNLEQVQRDGAAIEQPQADTLACGETGFGKMAESATLFSAIETHFRQTQRLAERSAIVTAGGTIERVDSVRYLSNFSSGKQGSAIAQSLAQAGAKVTLIAGNMSSALPVHPGICVTQVESAEEMNAATHAALPADIFVSCAAVCDFRVVNQRQGKIKKETGLALEFERNPDILQSVGALPEGKRPSIVIGFAAETEDMIANARAKLEAKSCDLIVANDVGRGAVFGKEYNHVHFVTRDSETELKPMPKTDVARAIVYWIQEHI